MHAEWVGEGTHARQQAAAIASSHRRRLHRLHHAAAAALLLPPGAHDPLTCRQTGTATLNPGIMPVPGKRTAAGGVSAAATRHTRRRCRCPTCQEGATRRGMLPSQPGDGADPAGRRGAPSGLQGELHGPRAAARRGAAAAPICKHLRTGCRWWGGASGPPGRPPWQPVQPPLLCSSGEEVWLLPASREDGTMPGGARQGSL